MHVLFFVLQPVFPWDHSERDTKSSGVVHWHGAGNWAEPNPAASGQRGVPLSRHRHQPAADVQGHPGTAAVCEIQHNVESGVLSLGDEVGKNNAFLKV